MAYAAIAQRDVDVAALYPHSWAAEQGEECALLPPPDRDTNNNTTELESRLFMDSSPADQSSFTLTPAHHNTAIRSTPSLSASLHAAVEKEDAVASTPDSSLLSGVGQPLNPRKQRRSSSPTQSVSTSLGTGRPLPPPPPPPHSIDPSPVIRTASGRNLALRHPTPDWHSPNGSFLSNVEHLERTAEKLSMTSSIEDAIRQMHHEQKRSESRRSSLLGSPIETPQRKVSSHSSIVDVNSAARSGGYSPGGFNMTTTNPSLSSYPRNRPEPKVTRFGTRSGSDVDGNSLHSLTSHSISRNRAAMSATASVAENDGSPTMTRNHAKQDAAGQSSNNDEYGEERPITAASGTSSEQARKVFSDFDGEHFTPRSREVSDSAPTLADERPTSSGRLVMPRPQTYADRSTGQQMVYYPAPVPIMLKLPEKLSKLPSTMERDKRRSELLSGIPQAARQSAIWLPDVLEDDGNDVTRDDPIQQQEYMPQHQRQIMGGRRTTRDVDHLPPQLRASAFFDCPSVPQTVELKGNSAVKTLDSILNASAFAPVSAFIDHAFAGRLGPEVYGPTQMKATKVKGQISETERRSSFNLFNFRRNSSKTLLASEPAEKRRSTMPGLAESGTLCESPKPESDNGKGDLEDQAHSGEIEDGVALESESEAGERPDGELEEPDYDDFEIYHGAPTTLLAELQLRKQHQKQRTRPATIAYPNGMHSTLLERDAVAQIEKKARKLQRVNLAWEDPALQELERANEADEDVPLGLLFRDKTHAYQGGNRPMGLMEKRDMEDNEPLSRRRDRLLGRPAALVRASTMFNIPSAPAEEEDESLARRAHRLKEEGRTLPALPTTQRVSGNFTAEVFGQFGGEELSNTKDKGKGKGKETLPVPDEDGETLGQRRKRLQAEREARAIELAAGGQGATEQRPALKSRHSMADLLTAHPAGGAGRSASYNFEKPATGLLAKHERQSAQRSAQLHSNSEAVMNNFVPRSQSNMFLGQYPQQQMMIPFANPYMMGYNSNPMMGMGHAMQPNPMAMSMLQMAQNGGPLNQGQIDMVERWRQSVMQ